MFPTKSSLMPSDEPLARTISRSTPIMRAEGASDALFRPNNPED